MTDAERADSYADVLRSIASWLGTGGCNATDQIDAYAFEKKIRDGVETLVRVETVRREKAENERDHSDHSAKWERVLRLEAEQKLAACRPSDEAVAVAMLAVKLWTEADQYIRSRMMPKTMKRLADEIIRLAVEGTK